jgi:hypothetical protein
MDAPTSIQKLISSVSNQHTKNLEQEYNISCYEMQLKELKEQFLKANELEADSNYRLTEHLENLKKLNERR